MRVAIHLGLIYTISRYQPLATYCSKKHVAIPLHSNKSKKINTTIRGSRSAHNQGLFKNLSVGGEGILKKESYIGVQVQHTFGGLVREGQLI